MVSASIPEYLQTWADEIASRGNRVRRLIGDAHWLSDGMHKEFVVREFLRRHLPNEVLIERGFIRSLASNNVSREIDVLISLPRWHVPLFCEGGLQIVAPSSVLASLEVKSTYRPGVLRDALENVLATRKVALETELRDDIWSGIFFADKEDGATYTSVLRNLQELIPKGCEALGVSGEAAVRLLPSTVCVMNACLVLLRAEGSEVTLTSFRAGHLGAALGFAQLFSFIRAALTDQTLPGELDTFLERVEGLDIKTIKLKV